jgi:hypothetical protein
LGSETHEVIVHAKLPVLVLGWYSRLKKSKGPNGPFLFLDY